MSSPILFLKSHVRGYTRADGTYVRPHEDKRRKREFGSQLANLARRAYDGLSYQARHAVDSWNVNWDTGALERAFQEGSPIADEIRAAFEPVRQQLRQMYGDTVPLYRGEKDGESHNADGRKLFSWSPVSKLAESFAGNSEKGLPKLITDEEIERAVDQYERTGYVSFRGQKFIRSKDDPQYFNIYDRNNQFLTDGDDLRYLLTEDQEWNASRHEKHKTKKGKVYRADVPVNSLVWIPTGINLKEPEFIAEYNPRKQPAALMAKAIVFLRPMCARE